MIQLIQLTSDVLQSSNSLRSVDAEEAAQFVLFGTLRVRGAAAVRGRAWNDCLCAQMSDEVNEERRSLRMRQQEEQSRGGEVRKLNMKHDEVVVVVVVET